MYSFYFGSLLLPVTPQKLTTKIKGNNKTLTLVNEGDINQVFCRCFAGCLRSGKS